jgi:hypothetical protein
VDAETMDSEVQSVFRGGRGCMHKSRGLPSYGRRVLGRCGLGNPVFAPAIDSELLAPRGVLILAEYEIILKREFVDIPLCAELTAA